MSNNTGIKKQILKELAKNKVGLTNFELSEKLGLTRQQVQDSLRESSATNYVTKGENLGAEGINFTISNAGLSYLKRNGEKSPLTQNEKTPVETVEAAPIVEESPLEQKLPDDTATEIEYETNAPLETELTTGIEDFETRAVVYDIEDNATESVEMPLNKMEYETFEVFQLTDELASSFISLMQSKQAKPIENIDYKIATLESLADIYNPKIGATLREIAADLKA